MKKVLEFERAVMATLMDDTPRVVTFDFDPLPLLRGLAEGRLTNETGRLGRFEIEVTGDGLLNAPGLGLDSLQRAVPFPLSGRNGGYIARFSCDVVAGQRVSNNLKLVGDRFIRAFSRVHTASHAYRRLYEGNEARDGGGGLRR